MTKGSKSKQKGGGVFDVFCPLCNLPFYSPFEGQKQLTDDDEDEDLYDLRNTELGWLSNVLGVDDNTHAIMELKGDDRYGQFPIKSGKDKGGLFGLRDSIVLKEGIKKKKEYDGIGAAFHNDCFKYISQKSGRPINYQLGVDIEQTIEDYFKAHPKVRRSDDYQQQSYDFIQALEDNDPNYFVSPLEPDGKHVRQLLDDFIPSKKAASPRAASPRAASPRAASPRAASPRAASPRAASPRAASPEKMNSPGAAGTCSSQKDKTICIKKKCVWGKTNRCSKKRSTRKNKSSSPKSSSSCPSHKNKEECVNKNCNWGKTNRCSKKRVSRK